MKVTPVKKVQKPGYPDRYEIDFGRDVLYRRPVKWSTNPAVSGLLATVLVLGLSACEYEKNNVKDTNLPEQVDEEDYEIDYSCVTVTHTYILSEEKAMTLITNELKKVGMTMSEAKIRKNTNVPVITYVNNNSSSLFETQADDFMPDGNVNGVDFEFLSEDDFILLRDAFGDKTISASDFYMKMAAKTLAEKNDKFAVLYNPIYEYYGDVINDDEGTTESEELIRMQVNEFIEWMRAQGYAD